MIWRARSLVIGLFSIVPGVQLFPRKHDHVTDDELAGDAARRSVNRQVLELALLIANDEARRIFRCGHQLDIAADDFLRAGEPELADVLDRLLAPVRSPLHAISLGSSCNDSATMSPSAIVASSPSSCAIFASAGKRSSIDSRTSARVAARPSVHHVTSVGSPSRMSHDCSTR